MMNSVKRLEIMVLLLWCAAAAVAQTNQQPTQGGTNTALDWALILQQEGKLHQDVLAAQQTLSRDTIASVKQSYDSLMSLVHVVGITVAIVGTLFGAWAALILKDVRQVRTQAAERLGVIEKNHAESNKKLSEAQVKVGELHRRVEECDKVLENSKELLAQLNRVKDVDETINDALALANIAKARTQLLSGDPREQLRAIEALAQDRSPRSTPVLVDTLRDLNRPPEILAEALYGLRLRGSQLARDPSLITHVVDASKHAKKQVRLEAVEAMKQIDPHNSTFRTRLIEIRDNDLDDDVKRAARHALQGSEDRQADAGSRTG